MKKWLIISIFIIGFIGCSSSDVDDSSNNDSLNDEIQQEDTNKINLTLKATYELPYVFGGVGQNVLLDGDSMIFIGGNKAYPSGAESGGHPAFLDKAIKIDLVTGIKETLDINASSGDDPGYDIVANGRGNSAKVYKLNDNKYLVYGGFQYVKKIEIIDFSQFNVQSISTSNITGSTGLDIAVFFTNRQGSSFDNNSNIYFFGFNDGLYAKDTIIKYNYNDGSLILADITLSMPRSNTTAHKLADGRIIVIGGWDGSGDVTPDSATRRVIIFNPNDNSVIRVANYPEPIYEGQRKENGLTENDSICIGNYQYIVSGNRWENGCTINDNDNFDRYEYEFPNHDATIGNYINTLPNGDIVYLDDGTYSSTFSDTLLGYPVDNPTKIFVYTRE